MRGEPDRAFCVLVRKKEQPPPGRLIDPESFGVLLYVGGRWSGESLQRRVDVRELEPLANGLPALLTLLSASDALSVACETAQGSLCVMAVCDGRTFRLSTSCAGSWRGS
jgi:hypothetical protein